MANFLPALSYLRCFLSLRLWLIFISLIEKDTVNVYFSYSEDVARVTLYLFLFPIFMILTTSSIGTVLSA